MSVRSPYRGLAAFEDSELDALYFFGRERDSGIVVANLIASRLTLLYGPSGVGKSSLLLASVARALRSLPEEPVVVVFNTWGEAPEPALARSLAEAAGVEATTLIDVASRAQGARDVYLVLDQAEEYFTYHPEGDDFDRALAGLVDGQLRVNVLLSLREDTLASLDRLKSAIPSLFANVLRLDRLDRAAGQVAIVKPLDRWAELEGETVGIEDDLVAAVLDGVETGRIELRSGAQAVESGSNGRAIGIEAPYLQLVMQRLWDVERSSGSSTLRAATLDRLGGAGQVVADHLERAIGALTAAQREIAALLFDHLVTPSGTKIAHEASDLAQFARRPEVEIRPVLDVLGEHRILRTDEAGRWEIFHDVLASAVLGWTRRFEAEQAVVRTREEARRRHRRLALLAVGALVALAAAMALAAFAFSQRSEAREQARAAKAGQLVASTLSLLDDDPELGIALALEAAGLDPNPRAEDALRRALDVSRLRGVIDTGRPMVNMDLDPTGVRVLAVGEDGVVRVYDRRTGKRLWSRTTVGAAAFMRRGRIVLLAGGSRLAMVDAATGALRDEPLSVALPGTLDEVVPSPTGNSAIALVGKPRAPAVDLSTGERIGRVKQPAAVTDVAFSPSGRLVASAGRGLDRSARIWDVTRWEESGRPLVGHVGQLLSVAFDQTGKRIVTGSTDQTARVWWGGTRASSFSLIGHTGYVTDASFGPGGVLVTASGDGTARTWSRKGTLAHVLLGHVGVVRRAEFASPTVVVTGGADGVIRTWDPGTSIELVRSPTAEPPPAPRRRAVSASGDVTATADGVVVRLRSPGGDSVLEGHKDQVNSVALSPDNRLLVSAGRDHDVIVWDVERGVKLFGLEEAQSASVADARFSPDGRWLVTAGPRSARLWTAEGEPVRYLYGPKSQVVAVGFEPDSRTVVSREADGAIRRWPCQLCGGLEELTSIARNRLRGTGRVLTDAERGRYLE